MQERTLGDRLRMRRLKLKQSLKDIEKQTGIPLHFLLALELNQFDVIPPDQLDSYISDYAKAVSLAEEENYRLAQEDTKELKPLRERAFMNQTAVSLESKEDSDAFSEQATDEKTPITLMSDELDDTAEHGFEEFEDEDIDVALSRTGRRKHLAIKQWLVSLTLLLIILIGASLAFLWYKQSSNLPVSKPAKSSQTHSSASAGSSSSSQVQKLSVTQDANGANQLTLSQAKRPVTIEVSLTGEKDCWITLSNTDLPAEGMMLNASTPSVTAHLQDGFDSSVMIFGYPEGVKVTVNGQEVDLKTVTSANNMLTLSLTEGE